MLDEASTDTGVEAPYLQLVLERLWEREREEGSRELRLATLRAIGGARAVVREHVQGALDALPLAEQEAAARVVRQLVTPSGRKVSHEPSDLAEYADVEDAELRRLLERLGRERIVRGVNGMQGAPTRYEIFHDVLGPPILAWQAEHQLQRERIRGRQQRRRLLAIIGASLVALAIVAGVAIFALVQRSNARTQARHAHGGELAGRALADIPTNPQVSVQLALQAARARPGTPDRERSPLEPRRDARDAGPAARREHRRGLVPAEGDACCSSRAATARLRPTTEPAGGSGLTASPDLPRRLGARTAASSRRALTAAASPSGCHTARSRCTPWRRLADHGAVLQLEDVARRAAARTSDLLDLATGQVRTIDLGSGVLASALDPNGDVFAVATRLGKSTSAEILNAHTGRVIRRLPEAGIRSFAFSPDGKLLASGSHDRTARIWNARTGRLLHVLQHQGYVLRRAASPVTAARS